MVNVGMDVHQHKTVCELFDPATGERRQKTVPTTRAGLTSVLEPFKGQCRVVYEVGTQAQWVASVVRPLAAEVHVANAARIPWLFRDGRKNDRNDAHKLVTLLHLNELPTVHLPAAEISAWRALINHRRKLIQQRTTSKNSIRSILRAFACRCPQRNLWTGRGMTWLKSLELDVSRALMMRVLIDQVTLLSMQIMDVHKQLDDIAQKHPNVALLRTIPGIGPRTAEAVVAFADDIKRFRDRKRFASYFGMTPALDSSGGRGRDCHISKRGPSVVRWVLIEAAHQTVRRCPAIRAIHHRLGRHKKERRKKAIVGVGRKLLTIMFAMLRDQTAYSPDRVCAQGA